MSYKIMIVDDEPANLRLLERLFRRDYQVISAASGAEALRLLDQHDVALLITDQRMPGMTGIELLKRTAAIRPHMVRIILTGYTDVSALVEAINCGQVYKYVTKPWSNDDLRQTVSRALEHYETRKARHELITANQRLATHLKEMTQGFVRAITDALEAKDEYIYGHVRRVSGYATAIGHRMGLAPSTLEQISLAGFLHDIGKIGTPESILLKPALLTDEERAIMQLHSERGARMLAGVPSMHDVALAVRHHHEHFDGTGYPEGLRGEQIPLTSRIIHVADAYDAMTSPRQFRNARDHEAALKVLQDKAGTQFDPEVVRVFGELETLARIRRSIAAGICGSSLSLTRRSVDVDKFPLNELIHEVEADPVLATCVLRVANTGYSDSPTLNLKVASARLGEAELRALIAQNTAHDEGNHRYEQLWEHSLHCAAASRLLAEHTKITDADDAYTLGLIHDIGEVLLMSLFPGEMAEMQDLAEDARRDAEIAAFGVDHAQVGEWVLEACGVPRTLTAAVQAHHDVLRVNAPAALLLHVANAIAQANDPHKVAMLDALGTDRLGMLRLSRADLASIHARAAEAIENKMAALC